MAKDAFNKRKELLTRSIRVDLRKRLVKTLVWQVVMYGCETGTMRKEEINRLNAFECGCGEECERLAGWIKGQMNKCSAPLTKEKLNKNDMGLNEELDWTCCKGRW